MLDGRGSTVATYTYDAFGSLKSSTGTVSNPFQYAGQYTDSESGLQYLRARYYDPATAQFVSVDPLTAITLQPYGYASDNPLSWIDPSGLVTGGLCFGGSASVGPHLALQVCLQAALPDSHSAPEIGVSGTVEVGGGTPSASVYAQAQGSNAVHISDLRGPFISGGGSAGEIVTAGAEGFVGSDACGLRVVGGGPTIGLGGEFPVPAEAHAGISYTATASTSLSLWP